MKKFFSEKNLRKQASGSNKPKKKVFKSKIKLTDVLKRQGGASRLHYGDAGIMAAESGKFTFKQLDSVRRSLMRIRWKTCA